MRNSILLPLVLLAIALLGCASNSNSGGSNPGGPSNVGIILAPPAANLQAGQTQAFVATVTGTSNTAVAWSVMEASAGGITPGGLYTAPGVAGTFHVRAESVADPSKSLLATVTVTLPPPTVVVSISPTSANLQTGQTQSFIATVTGTTNTAVTWSVVEASGGSVNANGLYTAPGAAGTFHVRATSLADMSKSVLATVTVTLPPPTVVVSLSPTSANLQTGQTRSFSATVTGATNTAVTWSVVEASGGTINASGLYTAPGAAGTFHVRATSVADMSKSVLATVTVTLQPPTVVVSINPTSANLQTGQTRSFSATVTGATNTAVTWSVVEASGGTINASGLYTAPGAAGTFHVRATSVADPGKSDQATVTVTLSPPPVSVTVSPSSADLQVGQTQPFSATVTGATNTAVTWSVVETSGGSIDAGGLYTAPGAAGTFHVRATSLDDPSAFGEATVTITSQPPAPSSYLFLTTSRLAVLRADVAANTGAWAALKQNVDDKLTSTDGWDTGPENFALVYLLTGDGRYADRAYWWAQQRMAMDLRRDSYYDYGEIMQGVALVLNWCAPALSTAQANTLAGYLNASTDELWNHNQGSGWGLDNPRNNYHHNFLMGTAYAGYALKAGGDARGDAWIALLKTKLESPQGVMAYLNTGVPGGDWDEGVNYAEGSKMHLTLALAIVAAAGGTDYFNASPFFSNLPRFAIYATQPGGHFMYPGGDLARDSSMPLSPYERAFMQPSVFWLVDSEGRQLGQWFLNHLMPSYMDGDHSFNLRTALYLDVLFGLTLPEKDPADLPASYCAPTTNWVNLRSGWDTGATSLSISGSPRIIESHQHMDTGSFTIWKNDWQAASASTFSHSGEIMVAEGHNLLRVPHAVWLTDETALLPGMTHFEDKGAFAYAQVDSTRLYREVFSSEDIRDLLNEHTREFVYLRPNTLVVFDRVDAKADGQGFAWCMHFPVSPGLSGDRYSATHNGGASSLVKLLGGASTVVSDGDLEPGTTSYRVEEAATGAISRFLNVVEVAAGTAPATQAQLISTPGAVQGALAGTTVVLFSDAPKGAAPTLPFNYTVPGTATLTHIICNLATTVDLTATIVGSDTRITVSAGTHYAPDVSGVVTASLSATVSAPAPPWTTVTFPWQVFDGSVPDVPGGSHNTWYCDVRHGDDAWDGTSFTFVSGVKGPKKTVNAALATPGLGAGDIILLGGGVYRERLDFSGLTGMAGAPITLGSYGHGTGAPILDGGLKPTLWTRYSGQGQTTVWQTNLNGFPQITAQQPVLGIYVNSGASESALREVPHGQLYAYASEPLPANQNQSGVTDHSNAWYFDSTARVLYADFGGTLGNGDPNGADLSVLYNSANGPAGHQVLVYLPQGSNHINFTGLTLRASSWTAVYSESGGNTFDHCDVKFNGGGGIAFDVAGNDLTVAGNSATYCRLWMNVLENWPRFNNGNTSGGWPGSLSWFCQSDGLAQGNAIYQNGGEGLIFWGTNANGSTVHLSTNNVGRNNVVFDNWSVNVYADNTQNARFERNFVFVHPRDAGMTFDNLLSLSAGYNSDWGRRMQPINLSLADEPGSSFEAPTGHAHLANITVINNIFAGGNFGFLDYDDGTAVVTHGLKNCFISNNTWVLPAPAFPGQESYGWRHSPVGGSTPDPSTNSFIQNNLITCADSSYFFVQTTQASPGIGITLDYNLYSGNGLWGVAGMAMDFMAWKAAVPTWDAHSLNVDARLVDPAEFSQTATQKFVYDWAKARLLPGSPALHAGVNQSSHFTSDFTGAARANASYDLGAIAGQ